MKGTIAIFVIACCLMFPGNIATGSDFNFSSFTCGPSCAYCQLTPQQIIDKAAAEAEIPFVRAWYDYQQGTNTISPLPCGWSVSLRMGHGGFVIIDIIDDL